MLCVPIECIRQWLALSRLPQTFYLQEQRVVLLRVDVARADRPLKDSLLFQGVIIDRDKSRVDQVPRVHYRNQSASAWRVDPSIFGIASRMSWTAKRKITGVEDIAYSLLGILDAPAIRWERKVVHKTLRRKCEKLRRLESLCVEI